MNSLLSVLTTLYALGLLYFPSLTFSFFLSPVLLFTLVLLLYLLQLGAAQRSTTKQTDSNLKRSLPQRHSDNSCTVTQGKHCLSYEPGPKQNRPGLFVEWDVRAPLEVIHEEYEGEETEENHSKAQMNPIQRYASLSLFFPDSDTDTSSDGDSPDSTCFRWEDEDDREDLIEIALDDKKHSDVDDENLIEIDLSSAR